MGTVRKIFEIARYLVVTLSFVSGFLVGAVFGETVINKFAEPTFLTFILAQ
jgi:F0F1-type ATP synthase assembly protein I